MNIGDFVNSFLPYAESVSSQTGVPVDYVLGQAGLESGWGTSSAATGGNNFFGISPGGSLASYPSPAAGFDAYGNLISSRYPGAASQSSPQAFGDYLAGSGYATDPAYGTKVAGAIGAVDTALQSLGLGNLATGASGAGTPSAGTAGAATATPAATTPGGWLSGIGSWLGAAAGRVGAGVLGVVFLIGAMMLFAERTELKAFLPTGKGK